ncbi:hypothetical protein Tco_1167129 [Tanacetum coccineum]
MDIRNEPIKINDYEKNGSDFLATVKAVEEVCVTCGSNHNFNHCPSTRNEFPVFHDNIHQFQQTAAVGNFVQRNTPNLENQMRPPGAVYQTPPFQPPYQAPTPQIQGVSKTDFENYVKANDAVFKNVQNQGTLPSQTVTNPREQINAITTRSDKTLEGPSTPLVPTPVVSIPSKEPGQNPMTSTDKVQKPSLESTAQVLPPEEEESIFIKILKPKAKKTVNVEIQDLNSPRPNSYQPKLPYPERIKVRENDKPIPTTHSDESFSKFLRLVEETMDNLEAFRREHTLLKKMFNKENFLRSFKSSFSGIDRHFNLGTINPLFDEMEEDVKIENSNVSNEPVLLNTPLSDKVECFDPEEETE